MLVLSVIFNTIGVFVIKLRLNELGMMRADSLRAVMDYFFLMLKSPLVISAVVLFFIAPVFFAVALSRMDIIVAYPVQIGLNFLCVVLLALIFLGEQMTMARFIGILFIFIGIYYLNKPV